MEAGGVAKKRTTRLVESVEACVLWCDIEAAAAWESAVEANGAARDGCGFLING